MKGLVHFLFVGLLSACPLFSACAGEDVSAAGVTRTPDAGPEGAPAIAQWRSVLADLRGGLASVWGVDEKDVWLVGSDGRDGFGPLVFHLETGRWIRKKTGSTGDLWWVHGFDGGPVFFAGSDGKVLRYENERFRPMDSPRTHGTVYGVWGADPGEVWAVGGDPLYGTGAFVWRYTGAGFEAFELPVAADEVIAYFKVWGTSRSDVWIVGTPGISLHWDGSTFERVDPTVSDPLFTVHSSASGGAYAAVGGADLGVIIERAPGAPWSSVPLPAGTRLLAGIWLTDVGGFAVGAEATVLSRTRAGWVAVATGLSTDKALHSVWVDPTGDVWAVGGDVLFPPYGGGVLIHRGAALPTVYSLDDRSLDAGDASRSDATDARDAPNDAQVEGSAPPRDGSPDAHARDAAPDALAHGEAGDAPPLLRLVRCGASMCTLPSEQCCASAMTGVPVACRARATGCPSGEAPVSCDEPSDCPAGHACCLNRYLQAGDLVNVQCEAKCQGPSVCQTAADCGGAACTTFSIMKSYTTCPPP